MPKLPGRKSTRRQVPLEDLLCASFPLDWERWVDKRRCCVAGCDHFCGNCVDVKVPGPAVVVLESNINEHVGYACMCCVAKILGE